MSAELTANIVINFAKGGAEITKSVGTTVTVAGTKYQTGIQNIGTSDATLDKGDVGTIGFVYLKNLDATNYCDFGADGTNYPLRLNAGEFGYFRWNGAVHAKAHTAATDVEYVILES